MSLTGSCLDGATNALKSVVDNGYGMVNDSLNAYANVMNMPSEMFDVSKMFSGLQQFIASLGIDKLVADMLASVDCLADSSMISDIRNEIDSSMVELGLDSNGLPDDDIYYNKMKGDLTQYSLMNGIDTSFTDSMSDGLKVITTKSNELSLLSKNTSDGYVSSLKQKVKDSVPKSPTPPSFF